MIYNSRFTKPSSFLYSFLAVFAMNLQTHQLAYADERIEVVKEISMKGDGIYPKALVQTKDGGFILAGTNLDVPKVIRIDANGGVKWQYVAKVEASGPDAKYKQVYTNVGAYSSAVILSDGSVALCGFVQSSKGLDYRSSGILTLIDKNGKVIIEQRVNPKTSVDYQSNTFDKCIAWDNGVAIVGRAGHYVLKASGSSKTWLLKWNPKLGVQWGKFFDDDDGLTPSNLLVMPNQDLIIESQGQSHTDWHDMQKFLLLDQQGSMLAKRDLNGLYKHLNYRTMVRSTNPDPTLRLTLDNTNVALYSWGDRLKDATQITGSSSSVVAPSNRWSEEPDDHIHPTVAYQLPDHSIVLFGQMWSPSEFRRIAGISWISSDLNSQENYIFSSQEFSDSIIDAIPTDHSGEFAIIRGGSNNSKHMEWKNGTVISLIKIKSDSK